MDEKQLPILEIISNVIASMQRNFLLIMRMGLPVIIVAVLSAVYYGFFAGEGVNEILDFSPVGILFMFLWMAAYIMSVVGIHRAFLLPQEVVASTSVFLWSSRESRFFGWSLLMIVSAIPIILLLSLLLSPIVISNPGGDVEGNSFIYSMLITLPVYYFFARWSLVLPSAAIDGTVNGLGVSWELTKGNGLRILVLVGLIPLCTGSIASFLYTENSTFINLIIQALSWVVVVLEIGLLSHSYAFLSEKEQTDTNTSEVAM